MTDVLDYADTSVPLTLLPVSLQTRFTKTELLVRVLPDAIHAAKFSERLTEFEAQSGHGFWRVLWDKNGGHAADISAARAWLAKRVGAYRARHVADVTKPVNWGLFQEKKPVFPDIKTVEPPPVLAGLLPDFWAYQLLHRVGGAQNGRSENPIQYPLAMAPNLGAGGSEREADDALIQFLQDQDLDWMINFKRAEAVGMAFRIPLLEYQPPPFRALLVTGVSSAGPADDAAALAAHLRGHVLQEGFDILPQGVPTNNSEAGRAAFGAHPQNVDDIFAVGDGLSAPIAERLAEPRALYDMTGSNALALAFGLGEQHPLGEAVHGHLAQGRDARQMNALLGPGIANFFTDEVFTEIGGNQPLRKNDQIYARVEQHFIDWVFGPGALPSLRIGAQPYGVLPVMADAEARSDLDRDVQGTLNMFQNEWRSARPVPTLDPEATDGTAAPDMQSSVAMLTEVLGGVPHPTNLHVRVLKDTLEEDAARLRVLFDGLQRAHFMTRQPPIRWPVTQQPSYEALGAAITEARRDVLHQAKKITEQQGTVRDLRAAMATQTANLPPAVAEYMFQRLRPIEDLLNVYREASDGHPLMFARFMERGPLRADLPKKGVDRLSRAVASVFAPDLYPVPTDVGRADDFINFLHELNVGEDALPAKKDRNPVLEGQAPLLSHLIQQSYLQVDKGSERHFLWALKDLKDRLQDIDETRWEEIAKSLELRLRETLGLFMHRFDAWKGSFANKTLAVRRFERPEGTVIGAYGWLFDLRPNVAPVSDGFIHAQSMNHAKTAALMRSAWRGFETSADTAPLAIDLSSDRVRTAQWILDGVRAGKDLSVVLGARLERRMRDNTPRLDRFIDDMRQLTLPDAGTTKPYAAMTDGGRVARAFGQTPAPEDTVLRTAIEATFNTQGKPGKAVIAVCEAIAAEMDSVADILLAQSVHSLAQGKTDEAAAVLNFGGDQQGSVPPISLTETVPQGRAISHRVVAVLPDVSPAHGASVLHAVNPALSTWLEVRIGALADYEMRYRIQRKGRFVVTRYLNLTALSLSTLELVMLAGRETAQEASLLARAIRATVAAQHREDLTDDAVLVLQTGRARAQRMSVDSFGVIASAARELLEAGRALRASDFAAAEGEDVVDDGIDTADLKARADYARNHLVTLRDQVQTGQLSLQDRLRLVALKVSGAVDLLDHKDRTIPVVLDDLHARIAALEAKKVADPDALSRAIARQMVIAPLVLPPESDKRRNSADTLRADVLREGEAWTRKTAKTSQAVSTFTAFHDLTFETSLTEEMGAVHMPHQENKWLAVNVPGATAGERRVITAFIGGARMGNARLSGLMLDSWAESVPSPDYQTGVAFHYDTPSARAPQCILLALLRNGINVDTQIFGILSQTASDMVDRCFGPDRYTQAGHVLPMTYLPQTFKPTEIKT